MQIEWEKVSDNLEENKHLCHMLLGKILDELRCETCDQWEPDKFNSDYGTCVHPEIDKKISVGYCDDWDFHKDFGCRMHSKGREIV